MDELGMIIGASLLGICFTAWLFALFFQVKKQHWYLQKQLDILAEMALKSGVSQEELTEIINRKV